MKKKDFKPSKEFNEFLNDTKQDIKKVFNKKEIELISTLIKGGYWCGVKDGIIMRNKNVIKRRN